MPCEFVTKLSLSDKTPKKRQSFMEQVLCAVRRFKGGGFDTEDSKSECLISSGGPGCGDPGRICRATWLHFTRNDHTPIEMVSIQTRNVALY